QQRNEAQAALEQASALIKDIIRPAGGPPNLFALAKFFSEQLARLKGTVQASEQTQQTDLSRDVIKHLSEQMPQFLETIRQNLATSSSTTNSAEHMKDTIAKWSEDIADFAVEKMVQSLEEKYLPKTSPSSPKLPAEYVQHVIDSTILAMTEQEQLHPELHEQ